MHAIGIHRGGDDKTAAITKQTSPRTDQPKIRHQWRLRLGGGAARNRVRRDRREISEPIHKCL